MATPSAAASEGRAEAATSKATEGKTERNDVVGGVKSTGKVRVFVCVVTLFYLVPSWALLIKKSAVRVHARFVEPDLLHRCSVLCEGHITRLALTDVWGLK